MMSRLPQPFELVSPYSPAGDQAKVIDMLTQSLKDGNREQTILGVTGSGKTYMMASLVNNLQKPTLVIAHNKTLAAQLAEEFKKFFPNNAVHYFVSYYDYYQPESYIPRSDTYIEKQTQINEEIERLRNATTQALLTRKDVLIVASVSCIYGLGNPEDFLALKIEMAVGETYNLTTLLRRLIDMQFTRTNMDLRRGQFRLRGDVLEVLPSSEEDGYRFSFFGDTLEQIERYHLVDGKQLEKMPEYTIFPAKQYVTTQEKIKQAIELIKSDLDAQLNNFNNQGKLLQAQRIKDRTQNDIEMLETLGYVNGIENYSLYFDGRTNGEPPATLMDYFPHDSLVFVDESHITLSQIGAMYSGDRSRKETLIEYGFRLPSALNNRPLRLAEVYDKVKQLIYVSATPSDFELGKTSKVGKSEKAIVLPRDPKSVVPVARAIIRPTGLVDPQIILQPVSDQVDDVMERVRKCVTLGQRVLITTLTKKFAEELDIYFKQLNIKSAYIHSDVETIDRIDILSDLRRGKYDVLIGINLLREGLDLPEVALVAIFDADKEGFLRSKTSLIQIIGRAARHSEGQVVMYADTVTDSMRYAIDETESRRDIQIAYNIANGITAISTQRELRSIADDLRDDIEENENYGKAGAVYSAEGWRENGDFDVNIESAFSTGKKKPRKTKSIHSSDDNGSSDTSRKRGKQVYSDFDVQKLSYIKELVEKDFSTAELTERLQIAIDAMNFEMAAAIRDLLNN
jgi:excinuclease ABC subunit B